MYKKATNKLHFKVGIMMEKLYNFVKKKKSGWPVEYFFIEPVTGNKHIINNGLIATGIIFGGISRLLDS